LDFHKKAIKNQPLVSASKAQARLKELTKQPDKTSKRNNANYFINSISIMLSNLNFVLMICSFGIIVGTFFSLSTLVNDTVSKYYIV
jgi:hypothetical protein